MASENVTKLIEDVKALSVLELSELVKALEEEFGVSAAAPVAVAAAPGAGDSPPRAAGTGSDNTSGSARHSSPPCRFPNCRRRKTDARQSRFTTIPQIKGNEKEMKGKWQIYQTKHD